MKLENQVVSLELAKKLKELGVEQESIFQWAKNDLNAEMIVWYVELTNYVAPDDECFSAFTVAELGEMLPNCYEYGHNKETDEANIAWFETMLDTNHKWMVAYDWGADCVAFHADTEADARAKMLIYLLENKLTPPTPISYE